MLALQPRSVDDAVQNLLGRGDALQAGSTPANPTAVNTSWESLWGSTPSWVTSGGELALQPAHLRRLFPALMLPEVRQLLALL